MSGIAQNGRSLGAASSVKIFGRRAGGLLGLFVLALCACTRNDVVVSKILINRLPGAERLLLERDQLREWIENDIRSHGGYALKPNSQSTGTLQVSIGTDRPTKAYVALQYESGMMKVDTSQWLPFTEAKTFRATFDAALLEMLDELLNKVRDLQIKDGAVQTVRDYAAGKPVSERKVLAAMEEVEQRRDLDAVRPLMAALKQENIQISLKAVAVLGLLGDKSAVDAITEFAERKVPEIRRHAIDALRKIGGRGAAAWLFTLSTGHSDAEVRSAAKAALQEVERTLVAAN